MSDQRIENLVNILHSMDQRAVQALTLGDYGAALETYLEILKAEQTLHLEKESGHTMLNISNTLLLMNQPEKSLEYAEKAASITAMMHDSDDNMNLHILKANILGKMNRRTEAENILAKALKTCKSNILCGRIELMLYNFYVQDKNKVKARTSIDRSVRYFELAGNDEYLMKALMARIQFFEANKQAYNANGDRARLSTLMASN